MAKLQRSDILSLEAYEERRSRIRQKLIAHKKTRCLIIGPHASIHFEDQHTMWYQVQEMLRAERIFTQAGIQEELDTYNELVPDGSNWKATLLFEYEDVEERQRELTKLVGIEEQIYVKVADQDRLQVFANDDMPRSNESKTAAVHFLRFEFTPKHIEAIRSGSKVEISFDHPLMSHQAVLAASLQELLVQDFAAN